MKKVLLLIVGGLLWPASVFADDGTAKRLAFIEQRLAAEELHRDVWQYGWASVYMVSAAANAYQWADAETADERWNFGVGTVRSGLALYQQLAAQYPGQDDFKAIKANNELTDNEKLQRAEALLVARAEKDEARFSWLPHIENIVANTIAAGLIAGFGDKDDAITAFVSGVISGELAIWTEPNSGEEDLAAYRAFDVQNADDGRLVKRLDQRKQVTYSVGLNSLSVAWRF